MKAKEYYAKYKIGLCSADTSISDAALNEFIKELLHETADIIKARKALRPSSLAAVIKETNQKYNAVVALFVKEYGASPLKRNGFLEYAKRTFSEPWLTPYL